MKIWKSVILLTLLASCGKKADSGMNNVVTPPHPINNGNSVGNNTTPLLIDDKDPNIGIVVGEDETFPIDDPTLLPCKKDVLVLKDLFTSSQFTFENFWENENCHLEKDWPKNFCQFNKNGILEIFGKISDNFKKCFEVKDILPISQYKLKIKKGTGGSCKVILSIDFKEYSKKSEALKIKTKFFELLNVSNNGFDGRPINFNNKTREYFDSEKIIHFEAKN